MRHSIVSIAALCVLAALFAAAAVADTRPITARDLWELDRIGSLALSPDGRWAAVVVTDYDVEKNEGQGDIWLVAVDGSGIRRFTTGPTTEGSPAWSPDGSMLAFTAKREGEKSQLHVIPLDGGEARAVTEMPLGA